MRSKRVGRFTLDMDLVQSGDEALLRLFGQVIVVETRFSDRCWSTDYLAISPLFDELDEGEKTPEYVFEFSPDGVKARRR